MLIKNNPKIIADIDWVEETDAFDISRMHDIVISLDNVNHIDFVIRMIVADWELLESQDDPRCYGTSARGHKGLKFPDNRDYLNEPLALNFYQEISVESISGVLFLCKKEAMRKLWPIMKKKELKEKLLEKFSQPSDKNQAITQKTEVLPDPVTLSFFDARLYVTPEEQQALRKIIQDEIENIDTANGREWFAFYAAYRYVKNINSNDKGYVNFFSDIERLLPDALTKVKKDKRGDERYKLYTMQLSKEVKNWYVDQGKLPPINTLVFKDYHFYCTEESFNNMKMIILRLFKQVKALEESLKKEKGIG